VDDDDLDIEVSAAAVAPKRSRRWPWFAGLAVAIASAAVIYWQSSRPAEAVGTHSMPVAQQPSVAMPAPKPAPPPAQPTLSIDAGVTTAATPPATGSDTAPPPEVAVKVTDPKVVKKAVVKRNPTVKQKASPAKTATKPPVDLDAPTY
jgi:hypothetical protein